jgi:2,3-dihydroxybiphenyl 1,2-dioxygenase
MAEISNLAYVGLGASDLDAWQGFAEDILGMQTGERSANILSLRMDDLPQRLFFERSASDDLTVAGWHFDTEAELEVFVAEAKDQGASITLLSKDIARQRKVEKVYACQDPNGYTHEFAFGFEQMPLTQAFRSKVLKSHFITGELGLGHILPMSKNGPATLRFYRDVLKLRLSDYIRQPMDNGFVVDAAFFHTKTGRHHSIATAEAPTPKILNHMMVQVADMDDVGLAYDRCAKAGLHFAAELGHHPNDQMFSFYVRTPSGWNMEFGWGGVVIDDKHWQVTSYSQMSDWGHKRNPAPEAA